jgi:ApaG protein
MPCDEEEIMPTPEMSEQLTEGIRVGAAAFYLPQESDPDEDRYAFGYTIVISNEGDTPAQLLRRHWLIIDANGHREEVRGPGVVGETPRLEPGQAFKYQSFCPIGTEWGTMEGSYTMQRDDGSTFEAKVGRFYLRLPAREPTAGAR